MSDAHEPRAALIAAMEARIGSPIPERHRRAYLTVDRARHVRDVDRAHAFRDLPLPLDTPHGPSVPSVDELIALHGSYEAALFGPAFAGVAATISGPSIYTASFTMLGLDEGDRMLELGSGTGYGAALAAEVVGPSGSVTTVDVDPVLVRAARERLQAWPNVRVLHADGLLCTDEVRRHNRIYIAFAVAQVPEALLDAIQEGAALIAPVGRSGADVPPLLKTTRPVVVGPPPDAAQLHAQLRSAGIGQTVMRYRRVEGCLQVEGLVNVLYIAGRALITE
jgi:protein-L-isoaspartate O-methyltransferase